MAVILNASTSTGYVQTADTSGSIVMQSDGTTQFNITSTGAYGQLKSTTAVNSTSGTSIEFTSIPSWVKRITVMFQGVSANSTNPIQVQIGSGSYTTSGYISTSARIAATSNSTSSTVGFIITAPNAADVTSGQLILTNLTGNTWIGSFTGKSSTSVCSIAGGDVSLSGVLDRLRIVGSTTGSPTDTFDAGSINILYEG